jgi:hypothetical protein
MSTMPVAEGMGVWRYRIYQLRNGTYVADAIPDAAAAGNASSPASAFPARDYDDAGALYYVIVVFLIYGISIFLLIGSSIKTRKKDNGMGRYLKDLERVRLLARKQEKFRTYLVMNRRKFHNILGVDRAVIALGKKSPSIVPKFLKSPRMPRKKGTRFTAAGAPMDTLQGAPVLSYTTHSTYPQPAQYLPQLKGRDAVVFV